VQQRASPEEPERGTCADHRDVRGRRSSLLHELASNDSNVAVRRLAIVCFKNGTPARETILILDGIADDDENDADVRKTARSVSLLLVKKSNQK